MNSDSDVWPTDLLATKLKKNVHKYSVLIALILVREGFGASLVDLGNYKLCFLSEETLFIVHSLHSEHIVPTPILESVSSQFHLFFVKLQMRATLYKTILYPKVQQGRNKKNC